MRLSINILEKTLIFHHVSSTFVRLILELCQQVHSISMNMQFSGKNFIKNEFSRPKGDIILNSLAFLYIQIIFIKFESNIHKPISARTNSFSYIYFFSNTPK